jgi:hypothetical protein
MVLQPAEFKWRNAAIPSRVHDRFDLESSLLGLRRFSGRLDIFLSAL